MTRCVDDGLFRFIRSTGLYLLALLLACVAGCDSSAPSARAPAVKPAKKPAAARNVEFIVFSAKWCAVCRDVPNVLKQMRIRFPNVTFRELDIDDEEHGKRWASYGADAVPYNFILADGEVVGKVRGLLTVPNADKFVRLTLARLNNAEGE